MPENRSPNLEELALEDQPTVILEPEPNGHHPGAATSVWDVLKQRREELAADRHLDLEVAGTRGLLALRLGPVSGQKQAQLSERVMKSRSPERDFNLNADYLIAACQAILGRADTSQPLEVLTDQDGEPVTLATLAHTPAADRLGLSPDLPTREVVRYLFGFAPSPEIATGRAAFDYMEWASASGVELDEEALGEA
jgi:hypothetical protein